VFTDKTGTLTKNNMMFRHLICGGALYGKSDDEEAEMGLDQIPDNDMAL